MRALRICLVFSCLSVMLVDTSTAALAAPGEAAPDARASLPAPAVLPAALLRRPTSAPARAATQLHAADSEGPSALSARVAVRASQIDITCKPEALKLVWPLEGTAGTTWVINNYTDLDPAYTKKDWKGGSGAAAMTYDGHRGYDIDVGSFREMDANIVLARAAAPGKVIEIDQSNADRNTSCISNAWNYVAIQHANGFVSYYGHLKKSSVKVHVGDVVKVGEALGTVGSSGCSTTPHLHFEVHDCDNKWFDAAKVAGMWNVPPSQREVSGILDLMLRAGGITPLRIKDPAPNPTHVPKGTLGIGLSSALKAGDELTFLVLNGQIPDVWSWKATGRYGHWMPSWDIQLKNTGPAHLVVWLNDEVKFQRTLTVQ